MVTEKPIITAELSINHLGMVNIAKSMIKSAKECGATIIKLKYKDVDKYYKNDSTKPINTYLLTIINDFFNIINTQL